MEIGAGDITREVRPEIPLDDGPVQTGKCLTLGDQIGHTALAIGGLRILRLG